MPEKKHPFYKITMEDIAKADAMYERLKWEMRPKEPKLNPHEFRLLYSRFIKELKRYGESPDLYDFSTIVSLSESYEENDGMLNDWLEQFIQRSIVEGIDEEKYAELGDEYLEEYIQERLEEIYMSRIDEIEEINKEIIQIVKKIEKAPESEINKIIREALELEELEKKKLERKLEELEKQRLEELKRREQERLERLRKEEEERRKLEEQKKAEFEEKKRTIKRLLESEWKLADVEAEKLVKAIPPWVVEKYHYESHVPEYIGRIIAPQAQKIGMIEFYDPVTYYPLIKVHGLQYDGIVNVEEFQKKNS